VLEWLLQQLELPFLRLDGSTAVAERLSLVDRCASSPMTGLDRPGMHVQSCSEVAIKSVTWHVLRTFASVTSHAHRASVDATVSGTAGACWASCAGGAGSTTRTEAYLRCC